MEFISLSNNKKIPNTFEYIKEYLNKNGEEYYIDVVVGTDSQNRKRFTEYVTVIYLHRTSYNSGMGKGGHILYKRDIIPRKYVRGETDRNEQRKLRLLLEVQKSIEVAEALRGNGIKIENLDIDINPNPMYKSYEVLREAEGWATGMGYNVRIKPEAVASTYAADFLIKHK